MVLRITSLSVKHKRTCRNGTTQTSNVKVSCLLGCFVCITDHIWEKLLTKYLFDHNVSETHLWQCVIAGSGHFSCLKSKLSAHTGPYASRTHCKSLNLLPICVDVTCTYFSSALRQSDVTLLVLHGWQRWHGVRDARSRAVWRGLQFRQQWLHGLDCRAAVWRRPTVERCDHRRGGVNGAEGLRPYVTSTTKLYKTKFRRKFIIELCCAWVLHRKTQILRYVLSCNEPCGISPKTFLILNAATDDVRTCTTKLSNDYD